MKMRLITADIKHKTNGETNSYMLHPMYPYSRRQQDTFEAMGGT